MCTPPIQYMVLWAGPVVKPHPDQFIHFTRLTIVTRNTNYGTGRQHVEIGRIGKIGSELHVGPNLIEHRLDTSYTTFYMQTTTVHMDKAWWRNGLYRWAAACYSMS